MFNLKKISTYKLINICIIFSTLAVNYFIGIKLNSCTNTDCLFRVKPGIYDPFITATPLLLVILGIFIFLPSHYFRRWLWYIASWAFPVLLYFISAESVYTSNIQSGPDFMAGIGMVFISTISAVFVICVFVIGWFKRYSKNTKK